MIKIKLNYKSKILFPALIVAISVGVASCNPLTSSIHNDAILEVAQEHPSSPKPIIAEENTLTISKQPTSISMCFTPPSGCSKVITDTINKATKSIYVQAYGFTDPGIADYLISAHNRGVKVVILLDKSNLYSKHSQMPRVKEAGIDVLIDRVPGIAHNKVMIIDQHTIITGSFNFSKNADLKNAENVIIINDPVVAKQYFQNWLSRKQKSSKAIKLNE